MAEANKWHRDFQDDRMLGCWESKSGEHWQLHIHFNPSISPKKYSIFVGTM